MLCISSTKTPNLIYPWAIAGKHARVFTYGQVSLQSDPLAFGVIADSQQLPVQLILQVVHEEQAAVVVLPGVRQPLHHLHRLAASVTGREESLLESLAPCAKLHSEMLEEVRCQRQIQWQLACTAHCRQGQIRFHGIRKKLQPIGLPTGHSGERAEGRGEGEGGGVPLCGRMIIEMYVCKKWRLLGGKRRRGRSAEWVQRFPAECENQQAHRTLTSGVGELSAPQFQCSEVPNRSRSMQNTAYGVNQCSFSANQAWYSSVCRQAEL